MTDYVSTPIRQTVKDPRIWLQGEILTRNGFNKGVNYTRTENKENGTITLSVSEHGSKVVSGKIRNKTVSPLIDIVNNVITEVAQGASELNIEMREGEIVLSVPHLRSKQAQREASFRQNTQKGQLTEGTLCVGIGMATLGLKQGFAKHGLTMSSKWIVEKGFAKRQLINEDTTHVGVINRHYTKRQSTPPMVTRSIDDKERLITVNEHARAKSCDPMLVANTSMTTAHEGLGQGVDLNQAIGLAEFIAMAICLNTTTTLMENASNNEEFLQVDFLDTLFV